MSRVHREILRANSNTLLPRDGAVKATSLVYVRKLNRILFHFLPVNNTNVQYHQSTKQDNIEGLKYRGRN